MSCELTTPASRLSETNVELVAEAYVKKTMLRKLEAN